jgi:hypothetical protein
MTNKIEVPSNSLWQYITKDHIDPNISNAKWNKFIEKNSEKFAERVSEIAEELWDNNEEAA